MTIDIIGAGIGGLTTAIALKQRNIPARIFEQAPSLKPVGAGIILANNAMQIFQKLGLANKISAQGATISKVCITNPHLQPLQCNSLRQFEKQYGVQNIALHRATLQDLLMDALNANTVQLGHELTRIDCVKNKHHLHFHQKPSVSSKLLIGADGIHSRVREHLFAPSCYRSAKQHCWRGIATFNLPTHLQNQLSEAWGKGTRFGIVPIGQQRVYWYALKSHHIQSNTLADLFTDYDPIIREIIHATPLHNIHNADIYDLTPLTSWVSENACLLGDAAHAMTPNLGQGACQAIEDAYTLADCLSRDSIKSALLRYQDKRMKRVYRLVQTSRQLGIVAHQTYLLPVFLRNTIMKLTPSIFSDRQVANLFDLTR